MSKKKKLGELITDNKENAEELSAADIKVASDKDKREKKISKLILENEQNSEELSAAYKIITTQEKEIKKQAEALIRADKEKEKRRADLISAKKELVLAKEKEKLVVELTLANKELNIQITERKRGEIELKESESSLRNAQKIAKLGSWEFDFINQKTKWSENLFILFGLKPYEIEPTFEYFKSRIHPNDLHLIDEGYENIVRTKKPDNFEMRIIFPDGTFKWIKNQLNPIFQDDKLISLKGINLDITKSKLLEEELKSREAKHSSMISNISDVIGIIGADGLMKYKSSNIEKWFGWQPQDLIGTDGFSNVHPDDLERVKTKFFTVLEKENSSITLEFSYKCKDGSYKPIELTAKNLINDPVIEGVLLNYHHITERKEAEKDLLKLNMAINNSGEVIFMTDKEGTITFMNNEFTKIYGFTADEVVGKVTPRILNSGLYPKENHEQLWHALLDKQRLPATPYVNKCKNGNLIDVEGSADIIIDDKGEIIGFIAIQRDVSERMKAESELIKAKEKAEASDRLKTAFMNNISHEIRTPLNGILGFAPFIIEPDISQEEKESMLEILNISGDRLINTVTDYMDISLITSGNIKAYPKPINLSRIIEEVYVHFQKKCSLKNLELKMNIPSNYEHFILTTDKEILTKVLNHLIDNAIKFTQKGFVEFGYIQKPDSGQKEVELFVKDTGQGISSNAKKRIFDAFMQEEIANTRAHEGSGLGLSIAKGLTQLLGGKIMLESEIDKGTTVSIVLPCDDCKEAEPDNVELIKDSSVEKSSTILIAEDNDLNYLFIETVLRNSRVKILKAVNGQEAVDLCHKHPEIDLVLMDIKMPVMNGIEATRLIKSFHKNLPIIAVTAFTQSGDEHRFREAGCDDYISKPINKTQLFGLIKKHCDK